MSFNGEGCYAECRIFMSCLALLSRASFCAECRIFVTVYTSCRIFNILSAALLSDTLLSVVMLKDVDAEYHHAKYYTDFLHDEHARS